MNITTAIRLDAAIRAVAPILGVAVIDEATKEARIDYVESATSADIVAGDAALAAFDWTEAPNDSFLANNSEEAAVASIDQGLTIKGGPIDRLVVALALVTLDEVNNVRANIAAATLAPRTATQLLNAIKAKLRTLPK